MNSPPLMWDQKRTKLFISLWKRQPALYDPKCKEYHVKKERLAAMTSIVKWMKATADLDLTIQDISRKIHTLRTQYVKEKSKIAEGRSKGETYVPRLWAYKLLQFLTTGHHRRGGGAARRTNAPTTADAEENIAEDEDSQKDPSDPLGHECFLVKKEMAASNSQQVVVDEEDSRRRLQDPLEQRNLLLRKGEPGVDSVFVECNSSPGDHLQAPKQYEEMDDGVSAFARSLACEMREIKSRSVMRRLKLNLLNCVFEAQEEDDRL